jgi:hypothetical protein
MDLIDEIFVKKVTELVKTISNDMELGERIRRLYLGSENINEDEIKKRNDSSLRGGQESRDDN